MSFVDVQSAAIKFPLVNIGGLANIRYNAAGLNPLDGYIYAIDVGSGGKKLIRVASDGSTLALRDLTFTANAGEVGENGLFYLLVEATKRLVVIDLKTPSFDIIYDVQVNNPSFSIHDLAWHDGKLWAVNSSTHALVKLDVATINWANAQTAGVSFDYVGPTNVPDDQFGAMYGGSNGVYGNRNKGGFYKFNLTNGKAIMLSGSDETKGNDGAKCYSSPLQLPTDFSITKSSTSDAYVPGKVTTFELIVKNEFKNGLPGISVKDPMPQGITQSSWTCAPFPPTADASCDVTSGVGDIDTTVYVGPNVGGQAPAVKFTVNMTVPPTMKQDILNEAIIYPPSEAAETDPTNNRSSFSKRLSELSLLSVGDWEDLNGDGIANVGDRINYIFTVTNTGQVNLTNINIEDPLFPPGTIGPIAALAPGATVSVPVSYTLMQADLDLGQVKSSAFATSTLLDGVTVESGTNQLITSLASMMEYTANKEAKLIESVNVNNFPDAGEQIEYKVIVSNAGTTTVTVDALVDPGPTVNGVPLRGNLTSFQPATMGIPPQTNGEFVAHYTLTVDDVDAVLASGNGEIENRVEVQIKEPDGTVKKISALSVKKIPIPGIQIEKTGVFVDVAGALSSSGKPIRDVGDKIDYRIVVTNSGSVPIEVVGIDDPLVNDLHIVASESTLAPDGTIDPGESAVYAASRILTQNDIYSGEIKNIAVVKARIPSAPNLPPITATASHTEKIPPEPIIAFEKSGELLDSNNNGMADPGEQLRFKFKVTNKGNVKLVDVHPVDGGPKFGDQPATGFFSEIKPGPVPLDIMEVVEFYAEYTLSETDIANAAGTMNGIKNSASVVGAVPGEAPLSLSGTTMEMTMPGIEVSKRVTLEEVSRGGTARFVLTVKALGITRPAELRVIDLMPVGFTYVRNSASVNGSPIEPQVEGRRLVFPLVVPPGEIVEIDLRLAAGPTVGIGSYQNLAHAEFSDGRRINGAKSGATINVVSDPIFDCGELIGRVFADKNRNGDMDTGEPGVPEARVVAVDGITLTTDAYGRFHLTCADLPARRIGSTFLLKLDPSSLPSGYRILSENPRSVRLTAGKVSRINFATSIMRVVRVDINADAFLFDGVQLRQEWHPHLLQLIAMLQGEPSILRLSYIDHTSDRGLAAKRVDFLRTVIRQLWKERSGQYRLEIESRILNQMGQGWDEPASISWAIQH